MWTVVCTGSVSVRNSMQVKRVFEREAKRVMRTRFGDIGVQVGRAGAPSRQASTTGRSGVSRQESSAMSRQSTLTGAYEDVFSKPSWESRELVVETHTMRDVVY